MTQQPLKPADLRKIPGYEEFKKHFTVAIQEIRKFNLALAMNLQEYWDKFFGKGAEYFHVNLQHFDIIDVEIHMQEVPRTIRTLFYDDYYYSKALKDWTNYFRRHRTAYNIVKAVHKHKLEERFILFVEPDAKIIKEEKDDV